MGEDPDAIRARIEETRGSMGDTIEAIGYKTDVKSRAKDSVTEKTDAVKDKVNSVMGRANDATPSGEDAKQAATRARRIRRTQEELEEGQRRPCCWPGCKHRERTGK